MTKCSTPISFGIELPHSSLSLFVSHSSFLILLSPRLSSFPSPPLHHTLSLTIVFWYMTFPHVLCVFYNSPWTQNSSAANSIKQLSRRAKRKGKKAAKRAGFWVISSAILCLLADHHQALTETWQWNRVFFPQIKMDDECAWLMRRVGCHEEYRSDSDCCRLQVQCFNTISFSFCFIHFILQQLHK